ncbi:hypothetical protein ACERK3_09720 [Phycisphaerales bacterium AB-hyl4]|uniref:DNA-binding protein n=1 Tax=Natronomicrosphaera hydrolytica TaxID=3242702 RepID=A0ABV4U4P7_9BACT
MQTKSNDNAGFLYKLSKIEGDHLTGAEAAKLLGMTQVELLGLAKLSTPPKPREVGVVQRYHKADLRRWALAGFPVDGKAGAYGAQRSAKIAKAANAYGITMPADREKLVETFQRDGTTTREEAERKANAVVAKRVASKR